MPSQLSSLSSYLDIEVMPHKNLQPKSSALKKLENYYFVPPSVPEHLVPTANSEKEVYSIVPTDCRLLKRLDFPGILNIKLVDANLEQGTDIKDHQRRYQGVKLKNKGRCHAARTVLRAALQKFLSNRNFFWRVDRLPIPKKLSTSIQTAPQPSQEGEDVRSGKRCVDLTNAPKPLSCRKVFQSLPGSR